MSNLGRVGAVIAFALLGTSLDAATSPTFSCSFGANRVIVTSLGGNLVYRYGSRNADELTIVQEPQKRNVFSFHDMAARSELRSLRFVNGAYSYMVFSFFQAGRDAKDEAGLAVFKGSKLLSQRMCKTYGEFAGEEGLDRLAKDPFGMNIYDMLKF